MSWTKTAKISIHRSSILLDFLAAAILFLSSTYSHAANIYWKVSTGDWSKATNWGGTEPTSSDSACIRNGGTATITASNERCYSLSLGDGDSGTVQMTGGRLTMDYASVGDLGTGNFIQSAGTNNISGLIVGSQPDVMGTYDLSGSGVVYASYEIIGLHGIGFFTHSAGINSGGALRLGDSPLGNGTYTLSGTGQLSAHEECIGYSGTGIFSQSAGTNTLYGLGNFFLGYNSVLMEHTT